MWKNRPLQDGRAEVRILVLTGVAVTALLAQRTTQLTGRITDATSAVIPGADVTVTNEDPGIRRQTKSNELGYYVVPLLEPGRYSVMVEKPGLRPIRRSGITLEIDQAARVDFAMEVGTVSETV